jgi:hypothetical protein
MPQMAGKVELPPVRGAGYEPSAASGEPTGVALFGIKRFSFIDCFSRSCGYCGLLSSTCHDYNYHSNDELRLRSIYCLITILPTFA